MNTLNTIRCVIALLAGPICGSALADPASAAEPIKVVSFEDLNLQAPSGVATLYRRIERAAEEVCQFRRETRQVRDAVARKDCQAHATDAAVRLVNLPALDARHFAITGRRGAPAQIANSR